MTPEAAALIEAARAWAKARGPIVSIGNAEHFARLVRAHEAEETRTADDLEIAVAVYEETL